MVVNEVRAIVDLEHTVYLKRQRYEISPERVEACACAVTPAGHFQFESGEWKPKEYDGFAIISMVGDRSSNTYLPAQLQDIQDELAGALGVGSYYYLPRPSFHQTIANTLSHNRFYQSLRDPGLEDKFPQMVANAFGNIVLPQRGGAIGIKLIGLSIFNTAIGVLGVIESEQEYNKLLSFRAQFYQDPELMSVDVKMTRPFIAHVTLAYIEQELSESEKAKLAAVINGINEKVAHGFYYFHLSETGLRRYHHLAEFKKEDHFPTFNF